MWWMWLLLIMGLAAVIVVDVRERKKDKAKLHTLSDLLDMLVAYNDYPTTQGQIDLMRFCNENNIVMKIPNPFQVQHRKQMEKTGTLPSGAEQVNFLRSHMQ